MLAVNPYTLIKNKPNANVLRFTPPGFQTSIDVPFPGRVLPVCEKCKKNFKTREHCRTRDCHMSLPWSDTFVCITLDETCTNEENKLLPGPFFAKPVPLQPFCLQGDIDPKTPICTLCKEKNYTRTYCRCNKKHRQLPWSTVYVVLSYDPTSSTMESMYMESKRTSSAKRRKVSKNKGDVTAPLVAVVEAEASVIEPGTSEVEDKSDLLSKNREIESPDEERNDIVHDNTDNIKAETQLEYISRSRTFLATVSSQNSSIEWLDYDPTQMSSGLLVSSNKKKEMESPQFSRPIDESHYVPFYSMAPPGQPEMYSNMNMPPMHVQVSKGGPSGPDGGRPGPYPGPPGSMDGIPNVGSFPRGIQEPMMMTEVPFDARGFPSYGYPTEYRPEMIEMHHHYAAAAARMGRSNDLYPMGGGMFFPGGVPADGPSQANSGTQVGMGNAEFGMQYDSMSFNPGGRGSMNRSNAFPGPDMLPPFPPVPWQVAPGHPMGRYPNFNMFPGPMSGLPNSHRSDKLSSDTGKDST